MKTERISGEDVVLVPFAEKHLSADYLSWLQDEEVVRYSEQRHRSHDLDSCRQFVDGMKSGGHHLWAIELNAAQDTHIGNVAAYIDQANRIADLSIMIGHRGVWGKGHGMQAWQLALDWLCDLPGLRQVVAGTMAPNMAMRRLFEKSGMVESGFRKDHYLLDGKAVDLLYVSKLGRFPDGDWGQEK